MVTSTAAGTELRTDPALGVTAIEVVAAAPARCSATAASIHRLHRVPPSLLPAAGAVSALN